MFTEDAVRFFGSKTKLALAAGVSQAAVSRWTKEGVVPMGSAAILSGASNGVLKFDSDFYKSIKLARLAQRKRNRKGVLINENQHGHEQGTDCPRN